MAKFIVTQGANFNPMSFQDIAAPLEYKQRKFEETDKDLQTLALEAEAILPYLDKEANPDTYAAVTEYINQLHGFRDKFYEEGYNTDTARVLGQLRTLKNGSVNKAVKAVDESRQVEALLQKARLEHPDAIIDIDSNATNPDTFFNNQNYTYNIRTHSGDAISKLSSEAAKNVSRQFSRTFTEPMYDADGNLTPGLLSIVTQANIPVADQQHAFNSLRQVVIDGVSEEALTANMSKEQKAVYDAAKAVYDGLQISNITNKDREIILKRLEEGFLSGSETISRQVTTDPSYLKPSNTSDNNKNNKSVLPATETTSVHQVESPGYRKAQKSLKVYNKYINGEQYAITIPQGDGSAQLLVLNMKNDGPTVLTNMIYNSVKTKRKDAKGVDHTYNVRDVIYSLTGGIDVALDEEQKSTFALAGGKSYSSVKAVAGDKKQVNTAIQDALNSEDHKLVNGILSLFDEHGINIRNEDGSINEKALKDKLETYLYNPKYVIYEYTDGQNGAINFLLTAQYALASKRVDNAVKTMQYHNRGISGFNDLFYTGKEQKKLREDLNIDADVPPSMLLAAIKSKHVLEQFADVDIYGPTDKDLLHNTSVNLYAKAAQSKAQGGSKASSSSLLSAFKIDKETGLIDTTNGIKLYDIFTRTGANGKETQDTNVLAVRAMLHDVFADKENPMVRVITPGDGATFGVYASSFDNGLNTYLKNFIKVYGALYDFIYNPYSESRKNNEMVNAGLVNLLNEAGYADKYLNVYKSGHITLKDGVSVDSFEPTELAGWLNALFSAYLHKYQELKNDTRLGHETNANLPTSY